MRGMKSSLPIVIVFSLSLLPIARLPAAAGGREAADSQVERPTAEAAVIICKGMIDDGLYKSIRRRTETAVDGTAEYLIYEIDTLGGNLAAAYDISEYFLHEVNSEAHTIAYVAKKAISAGALISVACEDIVMKEKTRIGDCAPIMLGGKLEGVEREKVETDIRAAFVNSAEANNYPEVLLKAMVTRNIEVYKIKNTETGTDEFFEGDRLPKDPNAYDLDNKELIVSDDELLTLIASDAFKYGVARALVKNRAGVLDFLAERDGVTFAGEPMVLKPNWSEQMVRWLNHPAAMSVLVLVALLGLYIEFSTPGIGLPGLAALICFAIIIGSKYLVGLANWVEVVLFVLGILLLMVEILVLPGFGIAGTLGIICLFAGIFGMLIRNPPDELPWPQTTFDWQLLIEQLLAIGFAIAGSIALAWPLAKYLPKFQFLSGLVLVPTVPKQGGEMRVSMTAPPERKRPSINVGDMGEVTSTLRPTGKAKFGDVVVDVVATAEFLDRGTKVEVAEIHGNRVVVRKAEEQPEE